MTGQEYIDIISKKEIVKSKITLIEDLYETKLPELVQKIVSNIDGNPIFLNDEIRILSITEIINAESDLHVDFKKKGIIPLFDCGNNDFITYHFKDKIWSKFNIIDEVSFKKKSNINELL